MNEIKGQAKKGKTKAQNIQQKRTLSPRAYGRKKAEQIQAHWREQGYRLNVKYSHDDRVFRFTGKDATEVRKIVEAKDE